jgi:CubicO group peptidase (beta-lactamase class C family)
MHPVLPTFTSPIYSNMAYNLLGLALQNMTGASYEDSLNGTFISALKLPRTRVSTPPASWGILTTPESGWGVDARLYQP